MPARNLGTDTFSTQAAAVDTVMSVVKTVERIKAVKSASQLAKPAAARRLPKKKKKKTVAERGMFSMACMHVSRSWELCVKTSNACQNHFGEELAQNWFL